MATPTKHALLSASSSSRWLKCTASPRFEEQFDESTSQYAEEGRLAHEVCEQLAAYNFGSITKRTYNTRINKMKKDPLWQDEMIKTAEFYGQYLWEKSMSYKEKPYVTQEVQVDYSDYVPGGFGTCDCVMIGGDTLHITDYKHGKGVEVSAECNSQMRLYALGALKHYSIIYGDAIKKVAMAIVQPRITENVSEETITVEELKAWGESIKPTAQIAFAGTGEFQPGSWCRFCRGKAQCRARSENFTALEDFKEALIEGKMTPPDVESYEQAVCLDADVPPVLSDEEIADLLIRGKDLMKWYEDIQAYALEALLAGKDILGWKAVAGRSNRAFTDADKAVAAVIAVGYDEAVVYEKKAKSLSELEKLMGKKDFAEKIGTFITKPVGKPTLVEQSDKREPYNPAVADFAGATQ